MAEELVAQAFTVGGALDQAGNVHELERGRDELADLGNLAHSGRRASGTPTTPRLGSMVQNG